MPKKRLSDQAVDQLTGKKGTLFWDTAQPGFGVELGAASRSYVVQTMVGGKSRREVIGRTTEWRYEQALDEARRRLRKLTRPDAPAQRATLREALDDLVAFKKRMRPRTAEGYRYALAKYLPDWMGLEVWKITPAMVRRRHAEIGETVGRNGTKLTSTANGVMRALRVVINHAKRHMDPTLGDNPVSTGLSGGYYEDQRRETQVPKDRLAEFWAAAEGLPSRTMSAFIRLTLATGMRSGECRSLRWSWVQGDVVVVPASVTKGKRPLRVADSDDVARSFRDHVARCSDMMSPA